MRYQITVEAGSASIAPGKGAAERILAAVEESNQGGRLEGLEDRLNPVILDPERVRAMLDGLPSLPAATLESLRGGNISLNDSVEVLGTASPVAVASLRRGFAFQTARRGGRRAPVLQAPLDAALAEEIIQSAREAASRFDDEVRWLENLPDEAAKLGLARQKRYAAALVWRSVSSALAKAKPWDRKLEEEAQRARETAARFVVAPWTGMPAR